MLNWTTKIYHKLKRIFAPSVVHTAHSYSVDADAFLCQEVGVFLERALGEGGRLPQIGGQVRVSLAQSCIHGLREVSQSGRLS